MEGRRPSHVLPDLGWRPSPRLTTVAQLAEPTVGGTTPTLGGTPPTLGDPSPSHEPNRSSDAAPDAPPPPPPLPPGKAGTLVIGTDRGADVSSQLSPISWGTLTPLPSASISDCEGLGLLDRLPRRFEHASNAGHEASSTPPFSPPPQLTPPPQPTPPPRISPPPASPPASTPADGGAPLNVLIVDDDPLTRKLMARMLQRLGHAVVGTAENGGAALSLIKASFEGQPGAPEIDMVFLDK
ncbi:hypothetical protein Q8F55_006138 [Vanrija albida]|uniref:Response regulatory domain-containing protein n=1 Tax=Vanrija albida TaxID=181172 RepID=A0ABR3PWC7_9TREE